MQHLPCTRIRFIGLLLLAFIIVALPTRSSAQVGVSITVGPPILPVYAQPICPGEGYMWTPGYWAYGPDGYYWVPGTWIRPPMVGVLWTPGYWGWGGGFYLWHAGYWGPHVGFYGGINYGFGYTGVGFFGGYWAHGAFMYNREAWHVGFAGAHVYNRTVINNTTINRVSYNGGNGGLRARPNAAEQAAEHEQHSPATSEQSQHEHAAGGNRAQLASENHGRPGVAATGKAGDFSGHNAVSARGGGGNAGRNGGGRNGSGATGGRSGGAGSAGNGAHGGNANQNRPNARTAGPQHSRSGAAPADHSKPGGRHDRG